MEKLKFATIGSYALDDIINVNSEKYVNVARYTGISPISLSYEYGCSDEEIAEHLTKCSNPYHRMMHVQDLKKTVFENILSFDPDYILFDFTEILSAVRIFVAGGQLISYTHHGYMEPIYHQDQDYRTIHLKNVGLDSLKEYAKRYVEKLIAIFGLKKLIMIDIKTCYQHFDKDGKWKLNTNYAMCIEKNAYLSAVYNYIGEEYNLKRVRTPDLLLNDFTRNVTHEYKFSEIYYRYYSSCIDELLNGADTEQLEQQMGEMVQHFVDSFMMSSMSEEAKVFGIDKGKKLVLIGSSDVLEEKIMEQTGHEVDVRIEYSPSSSETYLLDKTEFLDGATDQYYLLIPHVFVDSTLVKVLIRRGIPLIINYISIQRPVIELNNVFGHYVDVYNNDITCGVKIARIQLNGVACRLDASNIRDADNAHFFMWDSSSIILGEGVRLKGYTRNTASWNSTIVIGDHTTVSMGCDIVAHSCSSIRLGKDCMFARDVVILAGDGHAIFDLQTGDNLNAVNSADNSVWLGDHVWMGRESFLINCEVGTGSIIGAKAFVKGKYSNNCVIVGIPGKVVRKDVAWARYVNCPAIDDPVFGIPPEYLHYTE